MFYRKLAGLAALLLAVLPLQAQKNELHCFISDPGEGLTNIRSAPRGKVIKQVDALDPIQVTVIVQPGGWWRIKDGLLSQYGEETRINAPEAWIHYSVLALGTDNQDGQPRILLAEPRRDAPRVGTIHAHNASVRPLELSADGEWVKVKWEDLTGWMEVKYTRDDNLEPGDGFNFPTVSAFTRPTDAPKLLTAPGSGDVAFEMKAGHFYEYIVAHPKDGWWLLIGASVWRDDQDEEFLDVSSWIPASAVCVSVVNPQKKASLPLLNQPKEGAREVGKLSVGMIMHPIDISEDREWVKVYAEDRPDLAGWCKGSILCWSYKGECYYF